ncbi:tripartite tricarboxylate transporter substrate binding protein [Variovorax sp. J22P240]|uniref:Bug family tripartite tricarboxylate transporter substrate binding protein n=1 Tax=Variovorax sp. J22P240 TaxID=3053514 RepID=UPI0025784FEC|nr:tripartite tricarboxylate transporter substrate binding protein [Variovorax sp. J22P240]MDM0002575.1 tripartite tricarboxylate transporter substrate binding protein [Variovorax sp. J22P240]
MTFNPRRRQCMHMAVASFCLAVASASNAQDFPTKPIRLIAPFAAGASTDLLARTVAQSMSKDLGQPVIVENKPGAGGILAAEQVARAAPDGYTFLLTSAGIVTMNQHIYPRLPYDPIKDFTPLTIAVRMPIVTVVHPSLRVRNVQDLLAYAKANPGKLNYGSAGTGTSQHLAGELFKSMANVSMLHIPYKGGAPAMNDLLAGQVQLMFVQVPSALPQIKAGKIRAIAVGSDKRDPNLPDVPTVSESGVNGYNSDTWYGFVAPSGVAEPIIQKLHASIVKALKENASRLQEQGYIVDGGSAKQMGDTIKAESKKWETVIKAADIKPE